MPQFDKRVARRCARADAGGDYRAPSNGANPRRNTSGTGHKSRHRAESVAAATISIFHLSSALCLMVRLCCAAPLPLWYKRIAAYSKRIRRPSQRFKCRPPMSALGQKQIYAVQRRMSARDQIASRRPTRSKVDWYGTRATLFSITSFRAHGPSTSSKLKNFF